MVLTNSQKTTVKKLFTAFLNRQEYKFVSFKAPTGAGKTFMASEFISQVFAEQVGKNLKTIFVIATVSSANLPKQFAKKLEQYKIYHSFNNYSIEHIQSPSNVKNSKSEDIPEFILADRKVFVFGTSSFGKKTLFYQNSTLDIFLEQAKLLKYQIFFIRDEAHIGKKETIAKSELKSFDEKIFNASAFVIKMTATPKDKKKLIVMTKEDMENDGVYLLKNISKKTELFDEVSQEKLIDDALQTFKKTKKEYHQLGVIINPALLIQVMNETNYRMDPIKNQQFHETLQLLIKKIRDAGLICLKYLNTPEVIGSKLPNTLDYAAQPDSQIDVIIFKVGPATGWDIPRANMLLQLRNISSESLNMQTLGRIMRNPYPNLERNPITDKYYIWSNYQKPTREEAYYAIQKKFKEKKFYTGKINQKDQIIQYEEKEYQEKVKSYLNSIEFSNKIKTLNPKKIFYGYQDVAQATVYHYIPNHLLLKIENIKSTKKYQKNLYINQFDNCLSNLAKKHSINIELIKYHLFRSLSKIKKIRNDCTKWIKSSQPYLLLKNALPLANYTIWIDNNDNPKSVSTKKFKNYGYLQITENIEHQYKQYLDSEPEKNFFKSFIDFFDFFPEEKKQNIHFFAKMPSLGSQISIDYYSQEHGQISKSFMDFIIEFEDKIVMVEVKSKDNDYDPIKTKELLDAYKMYMKKHSEKKVYLVLFEFEYDKQKENSYLHAYINNQWKDNLNFRDTFDHLLGLKKVKN